MNFYEAQEEARRASRRLVLLFSLSVLTLIVVADLLLVGLMYLGEAPATGFWSYAMAIDWRVHATVAGAMMLVIAAGSLYKYLHVSAGGRRVAEDVGAVRVPPDTQDPARRRLLNIVEEMAIASGTPVPSVYVLERETGVNAFAAGLGLDDAVVCVTQGCLDVLNREQLQGVVAHEFSHILNGDMRLNLRVIGVLHGILLLGLIGEGLLRSLGRRRHVAVGGRGGREGVAGLMMVGIGLMALGYGGTLFGRLIKASVNRQREYLADASAVQFTRNPDGIAGALKVIGGHVHGSGVDHPSAPAISHMLLASMHGRLARQGFAGFATHPPLEQRIRRLDPAWDGRWPVIAPVVTAETGAPPRDRREAQVAAVLTTAAVLGALPGPGEVEREHLDYARLLLEELPESLSAAAHEPWGARALVCALLLDDDETIRARQLDEVRRREEPRIVETTEALYDDVRGLGRELRLPVVDLALPSLRELSPAQADRFRGMVLALVRIDRQVTPFEWAVTTVIGNTLAAAEDRPHIEAPHSQGVAQLRIQTRVVLSMLAHAGHDAEGDAAAAFSAGISALGLGGEAMYARETLNFDTVDNALRRLDRLRPGEKARLLQACAEVIGANHDISVAEFEMIRAIGAALHCPIPPLAWPGAALLQRPGVNP